MNHTLIETTADRFRRLADDFVATVTHADADAATPCDGWSVADVIDHVRTTQRGFLQQRSIDIEEEAELTEVVAAMQHALDDPDVADASYDGHFGPTTLAETVDAFYSLDLLLHRWDIAVASGVAVTISDADIDRCRELLAPMGDNIRMPGIFGPDVDVSVDASAQDRFLAWTGRDPSFQPIN